MTDEHQPWPVVTYGGAGPAPGPVVAALTQVLADVQPPTPVPIGVGWAEDGAEEWSVLWIQELADQGLTGVPIFPGQHESMLEQIADQLQEQFFPETLGAWGEARPACPGHSHPAGAELFAGEAWWVCPASHARVARIGFLHRQDRS